MDTAEKLRAVLGRLRITEPDIVVRTGDGTMIIAEVKSRSFEGMPEEDRQELVWTELLHGLEEDEQSRIEYVLTTSPSEEESQDPEPSR